MKLRKRGRVILFLAVVAIFAWPGFQAFTSLPPRPLAEPISEAKPATSQDEHTPSAPVPAATAVTTLTSAPAARLSPIVPTTFPTQALSTVPPAPLVLRSTPGQTPTAVPAVPSQRQIIPTASPTQSLSTAPTAPPTRRSTPEQAPTAVPAVPTQRHMDEKLYMLELINNERRRAGVGDVVLGDNNAAQLHAEASLRGCYSSHWGDDGLKPYMRYSLAGGYQSNGENGSGLDYCVTSRDGFRALSTVRVEIGETMAGLMGSPGHRRNILDSGHRKVNIGLAWDRYNFIAVQHFEGDHIEYETLPSLDRGRLVLEGQVKGGARFGVGDVVPVEIIYDPPPIQLTRGQLSKTYCYSFGKPVAYLRKPLSGRQYYPSDSISTSYHRCPDPYDVSPDATAPQSSSQAHASWQRARTPRADLYRKGRSRCRRSPHRRGG